MSICPSEPTALERRLERLEKHNFRSKLVTWLALLVAVGNWLPTIASWLMPDPPVIEASQIWLKNWGGHLFVKFQEKGGGGFVGGVKNDYGQLTLFRVDEAGKHRVQMTLGDEGLSLVLFDEADRPSAQWTVSKDGPRFEKRRE